MIHDKMHNPDFMKALKAAEQLHASGFSAYLVGGCVRSLFSDSVPSDYDLASDAGADEIREVFSSCSIYDTGIKYGTLSVDFEGLMLQITTFRTDGAYSDGRRPDGVKFTRSLLQDLSRRDFTVNAMAYNLQEGIIDPFGGQEDMQARIIRCVGNADDRFREDALRILRALRFCAQLGFSIEESAAAALRENKEMLRCISAERIYNEMTKLIMSPHSREVLISYADIICTVIPELADAVGFEQHNPHHIFNVYEHSAAVCSFSGEKEYLKWAGLLHDAAKPDCFTTDENGIGHFYGHAREGVKKAQQAAERLRFSTAAKEKVLTLVRFHDMTISPDRKSVSGWLRLLGEEMFYDLMNLKRADNAAQNFEVYNRTEEYDLIEKTAEEIIESGFCFKMNQLAVNGNDLISAGYSEGRLIGGMLDFLLDAVSSGEAENDKDFLLAFIKEKYPQE